MMHAVADAHDTALVSTAEGSMCTSHTREQDASQVGCTRAAVLLTCSPLTCWAVESVDDDVVDTLSGSRLLLATHCIVRYGQWKLLLLPR
jgi:hypothetical protein